MSYPIATHVLFLYEYFYLISSFALLRLEHLISSVFGALQILYTLRVENIFIGEIFFFNFYNERTMNELSWESIQSTVSFLSFFFGGGTFVEINITARSTTKIIMYVGIWFECCRLIHCHYIFTNVQTRSTPFNVSLKNIDNKVW